MILIIYIQCCSAEVNTKQCDDNPGDFTVLDSDEENDDDLGGDSCK